MGSARAEAIREEMKIYNAFALKLGMGVEVVDVESYYYLIDSRIEGFLQSWLQNLDERSVFLDFGCGQGSYAKFIKNELKNKVVGVDISRGIVEYALKKNKEVHYSVADCHMLPFRDNSFDMVLAVGVFHHLNLPIALRECRRILRKEGLLVVSEPNALGLLAYLGRKFFKTEIHTPNERIYTPWSFIREMKRDFHIIDVRFLSFLGFIFPYIWESKLRRLFSSLKRYKSKLRAFDQLLERIPFLKHLCWVYLLVGIN